MLFYYCRKCDKITFNWKNCYCTKSKIPLTKPQHISSICKTKLNNTNHYCLDLQPFKGGDYEN